MNYNELSKKAHTNAIEHGFWEEKFSREYYLMLVISEIGEMVEADRKSIHTDYDALLKYEDRIPFNEQFERFVKDTVEDELADVAIRLFDLAGSMGLNFEKLKPCNYFRSYENFTFTENAFALCKGLSLPTISIEKRILFGLDYVFNWAESLHISLLWHIENKMKYNANRPIRHGKKY